MGICSKDKLENIDESLNDLICKMSNASAKLNDIIRNGGELGGNIGETNQDGDNQKALDVIADDLFYDACKDSKQVSAYYSEEQEVEVEIDDKAPYIVAIDPLDGSSNIASNVSIGTIIAIFKNKAKNSDGMPFSSGREQVGAIFYVYGPQTTCFVTVGAGAHMYRLNTKNNKFELMEKNLKIADSYNEFAINASNNRHWDNNVANYVKDVTAGKNGSRGEDFNMRWIASLVADTSRIFSRGGVFLYPSDKRKGYEKGRLRLIYEAYPIAFMVEQAGGIASNGYENILDIKTTTIHQRTPLIFGSNKEVKVILDYFKKFK
jgi:fructose-1,6-bisphosphatase I